MADAFTTKIITEVQERMDEFIFSTIYPFCSEIVEMHISKKELTDALLLWKNLVRCKDCMHMEKREFGRFCTVWDKYNGHGDDGWCCYGERRTE